MWSYIVEACDLKRENSKYPLNCCLVVSRQLSPLLLTIFAKRELYTVRLSIILAQPRMQYLFQHTLAVQSIRDALINQEGHSGDNVFLDELYKGSTACGEEIALLKPAVLYPFG